MGDICWLTDVHLNFLDEEERLLFYQSIRDTKADAVLLTGDIAEAPSLEKLLTELEKNTELPIYFVLGNHDYYRGDVKGVRAQMIAITKHNPKLIWLGAGKCIELGDSTVLVGHDTWADGRCGDFLNSPVLLNDSRLIGELFQAECMGRSELLQKMQQLADLDAKQLESSIQNAIKLSPEVILIACHVPPFAEASWHIDKPSDKDFAPFFSSKVVGEMLMTFSHKHPEIFFKVYCGHTHTAHDYKAAENLLVRVGGAEYYQPKIADIIQV